MKKMVLPAFILVFLALLLYFGTQIYSSFFAPQVLLERDVTWEAAGGGELEIDEDGEIEGQLPLADGTMAEFEFTWEEQVGTAYDEDTREQLFTTDLGLQGTNLILEIREDNVGLSKDSYTLRRAG